MYWWCQQVKDPAIPIKDYGGFDMGLKGMGWQSTRVNYTDMDASTVEFHSNLPTNNNHTLCLPKPPTPTTTPNYPHTTNNNAAFHNRHSQ